MANFFDQFDEASKTGNFFDRFDERPQKAEKKSTIGSELARGAKQLGSTIRTGAESIFGSPEEAALAGIERGRKISEEAGEGVSLEAVKRAYEKEGLLSAAGEALGQVPRAIAGQVPQMAATLGAAKAGAMAGTAIAPGIGTVAGGILGAGASLLPQFLGANVERQVQEQIEKGQAPSVDLARAGASAAGQAALEGAGTALILGGRLVKGVLGIADDAALATNKARQEMVKAAERSITGAAGRGAVRGAGEIPVEIAQQVLERAQAGLDVTSPDALREYGEAAYQAAIVGGGLGAVSGPVDTAMARQARTQIEQAQAERERQRIEAQRVAEEERMRPVREAEARVPAEEPIGESLAALRTSALAGGETKAGGELAALMRARREEKEAAAQVPLSEDYAFLQREKQRLMASEQTPETRAELKRIDQQIQDVLVRDLEWRPGGSEAVRASVFGEAELPAPITREQLMAPKMEPFAPATTTPRTSLLGAAPVGGGIADVLAGRREAEAAQAEIPLSQDYAFLTREKARLSELPKTPETTSAIQRIEQEIARLDVQAVELRRRDAEAAKASVFAQEQLPPVERRGEVVAERDLAEMQAREPFPEPKKSEIRQQIEQTERLTGKPEPMTDMEMDLRETEESLRSLKAKNRGRPLIKALAGILNPREVSDIGIDDKRLKGELMNKAGKGTYLSELVSNGSLDEFLEPSQRLDSPSRDVDKATQTIREKIENADYSFYGIGSEIQKAEAKIDYLARSIGEPKRAEFEISEVEPGEAASIERTAGDAEILENLRYQRATTDGKSIGKEQTQSVVDAIKPQWKNAPEVVVAENMDDPAIPVEVREHNKAAMSKGAKGSPRGFFYKGKAYILADAATSPTQVIETLFHESLGHYGLRGTFGPEMESVLKDVVKYRRAEVEAKAKQYGLDPKNESDMLEAAEEVLAEIAQTKPGLSFVKRAIAVIRNFLRDLGLPFKMSNDDIIQKYILPARAFVEKGGSKGVEGKYETQLKDQFGKGDIRYQREEETEERTKEPRRNILGAPVLGNWTEPTETKMAGEFGKDDIIYWLQDKMVDTKRVVQAITAQTGKIASRWNPYLQEELYHGRTAKETNDFLTKELRPLMQEMQKSGVTIGEFEQYLHNRHAEEYNKQVAKVNPDDPEMQDGGSGITTEAARNYLADLPADKKKLYESLADRIDSITKGTRNLLVKSGLESKETIDAWEKAFPDYVPLHREDVDFQYTTSSTGTGQGFDVRGPFSRRAMGSKRNVVDILANIAMQRERAIVKAEKNRVAEAVYGLAAQNPNPDFWLAVNPMAEKVPEIALDELRAMGIDENAIEFLMKEPRQRSVDPKKNEVISRINTVLRNNDNVLSMRFNGENRYVFFNPNNERSARAAKSLKNLDAEQLSQVMGIMSRITRWMSSVNTQYNPIFGAYNFLRDVQGAALQLSDTPLAGKQKEVAANVLPSLKAIYASLRKARKGEEVDTEMSKLWNDFQKAGGQTGFRDMFSRSQERAEALQKEFLQMTEGKLKSAGRATIQWLSDYNDTMENAVRLAAYKVALDNGMNKDEAASLAKNLTVNFNKKGQVALQAGALYAFFNAAVQGTTRLAQTLNGPAGRKIMAGGALLGVMQAALLAMAGFDEEEPPEFVRERNIVIPIGEDKYVTFPMPLGYHVIPGTTRILTEWALGGFKDTPEKIASLTGMYLEAFNPIGNAGWSVQTIAPTFADPLVALSENKDWTGKPIARKDFSNLDPTPGYTRAKDTASWISTKLAELLNYTSGGTKYQPGIISPTPDQIDYLIGQATGGLGREFLKATTTAEKTATGEELPPYKIPVVGRFYGETKSSAAESNRFYKNLEHLNKLENEIKGRRENREPIGTFFAENPEARLAKRANQIYSDIKKLRDRKEKLVERNAPRESVKAVENLITTKMRMLNEQVERAKK